MKLQKSIIAVFCAVLFCGVTFWLLNCRAFEIRVYDAFGVEHIYNVSELRSQQNIIDRLSGDLNEDINYIDGEINNLTKYYHAAKYSEGSFYAVNFFTEEKPVPESVREEITALYAEYSAQFPNESSLRIGEKINNFKAVRQEISDCAGYGEYVKSIADNAEEMLMLSNFSDSRIKNNIIKTERDYYALGSLSLTPCIEAGYMSALCFRGADIAAAALTVFIGIMLAELMKAGRKNIMPHILIWAAGIISVYAVCFALAGAYIGLPAFGTAIQSLSSFRTCRYAVSCGMTAIISVAFRMLIFAFLLSVLIFVFSRKSKLPAAIAFTLFAFSEMIFALYGGNDRLLTVLREVNVFSALRAERFFQQYLNIDIFTAAVSPMPSFCAVFFAALLLMCGTACKSFSDYSRNIYAGIQKEYYDEIDRRYGESRKIRHDINNHLLALRLLIEKGDTEGASRYIGEISEQLDRAIMPVKTGSDVADALLCQKSAQANEIGAKLTVTLDRPLSGSGVSDYDLCGIFGNIIDNALEAVRNTENKEIDLYIGNQHNMLYISCENEFSGELKKSGGIFRSTKEDNSLHGIGLSRVREIARDNGGDINITAENNKFTIEILLNSKK